LKPKKEKEQGRRKKKKKKKGRELERGEQQSIPNVWLRWNPRNSQERRYVSEASFGLL
jgi:hypothetical protein